MILISFALFAERNYQSKNSLDPLAGSQISSSDLSTGDLTLKVTVENFGEVQKKVREFGIDNVEYGPRGELQEFTTKDGQRFEFSPESFEEFKLAGLLRLGRRITK